MVVEDDASNARLLAAVLKSEGAEVRIVRDAQEALGALPESRPRLIVLDLILPRMSGLMLARQLKSDAATRDVVLVAVSGITGPQTERMALDSGCSAYLAKPIDADALLETVRTLLGDSDGRE
jgi:CheY-like chemotaxis protein